MLTFTGKPIEMVQACAHVKAYSGLALHEGMKGLWMGLTTDGGHVAMFPIPWKDSGIMSSFLFTIIPQGGFKFLSNVDTTFELIERNDCKIEMVTAATPSMARAIKLSGV